MIRLGAEWNIFNQQREVNIIDKSEPSGKPEERKMNVRVQVGCSCAVDLRRFPFDVQRLECVVRIPRVHKQLISVVRADPKRSGGPRSLQSGSSWVAGINEFELAAVEAHVEYSEPGAANFKPSIALLADPCRTHIWSGCGAHVSDHTILVRFLPNRGGRRPSRASTSCSPSSSPSWPSSLSSRRSCRRCPIRRTSTGFPTSSSSSSLVVLYNMLLPCAADSVDAIDRIGLRIFCLLFVMVSLGVLAGIWSSVRARKRVCRGVPQDPKCSRRGAGRTNGHKGHGGAASPPWRRSWQCSGSRVPTCKTSTVSRRAVTRTA